MQVKVIMFRLEMFDFVAGFLLMCHSLALSFFWELGDVFLCRFHDRCNCIFIFLTLVLESLASSICSLVLTSEVFIST